MMEPAAPGTEDEVKLPVQTQISKKESEQERLLAIKTRLPNGKLGNVFELSFSNGSEHWYCNLCQCPIMGRVYHHEIGKRHTNNMQSAGTHPVFDAEPVLQIAPGEPVPPGVEGEIEKITQIQERLDSFTVGPLIGLEYLFELLEYDRDKEPSYLCLLCDKRGDPRTVIAHLASYNHIIQYTQRHFISCFRALAPYITKQYKRNWQSTMQKIAEAIENKFGRLKPHVVDLDTFEAKRMYYQNLVASGRHFSERSGVTFEELVDKEQLTKTIADDVAMTKLSEDVSKRPYRKSGTEIGDESSSKKLKHSPSPPVVAKPKKPKPAQIATEKRRSLSSVSTISSSDLSDFDPSQPMPTKKKEAVVRKFQMKEKFQNFKVAPQKRRVRKSRSRSVSPGRFRNRGPVHPWERSDYIRSRSDTASDHNKQKGDKIEDFKKLATAIENDMDRVLKQHEKNPEKHPQYNDEWKKYWNKRYKELQAEGKDVGNYDFKPGWIEFWNKRMSELHNAEIKLKKDALRKRLGLPEEPAPICFKITGKKKPNKHSTDLKVEVPSTPVDHDSDVIVIEDKDEDTISSKRSHSPWESETGSRPQSRRSREKSREVSRSTIKDRRQLSRDKSREYRRSRSTSRERDWHRKGRGRERERDYHRDFSSVHETVYYREPYRKSDLPEYIKPPRVMRDVTRHPVMTPPPIHHVELPESDVDDDEVNIVGVLRLLTALEEKLGSLGPKVIDLLGQALAMEKAEANSSEILLDNEMNCVLFETVKEKLKGQLLACLVDYNQEKAFKKAIKKIASLIHYAGERTKKIEKEKVKVDPIKVPGVGTVDKSAIAKQIATALVLQGKTDVSQAELEQLINAVVGMAEASKNSDKPMTTASFLQQLTQSKPSPVPAPAEPVSVPPTTTETTTTANSMEGLSDLDLQTLLQNFKDLCTDEQHSLISYLKKLEAKEPERVERLRKFVNLDNNEKIQEKEQTEVNPRSSPFANRLSGMNPIVEDKIDREVKADKMVDISIAKVNLDSDEDDYTFEDVFKAAKQNVKENEERERKTAKPSMFKTEDFDLTNAKSLIANIMGQFKASNIESASKGTNLLGLGSSHPQNTGNVPNYQLPMENLSSVFDLSKQSNKPNIQSRILPNQSNLNSDHNPRPIPDSADFSVHYSENDYSQHDQFMNMPPSYGFQQNQFNQLNFEQNRMPYYENHDSNSNPFPVHGGSAAPTYDNYNRW